MASWSENSSYQGAAAGATAGSVGGVYGAAAGAVVGFVAGGLIGGKQEQSARDAEDARQKAIQKAIDKQNTSDFRAKSMAEQWALSDLGINKEDQVMDAMANAQGLQKDVTRNTAAMNNQFGSTNYGDSHHVNEGNWEDNKAQLLKGSNSKSYGRNKYITRVDDSIHSTQVARDALKANEGILSSYDTTARPTKY